MNTSPLQLTKGEKEEKKKKVSNIGSSKGDPAPFCDSSHELTIPDWSPHATITHPIQINRDTQCLLGFHHMAYDGAPRGCEQSQVDSSQASISPLL